MALELKKTVLKEETDLQTDRDSYWTFTSFKTVSSTLQVLSPSLKLQFSLFYECRKCGSEVE